VASAGGGWQEGVEWSFFFLFFRRCREVPRRCFYRFLFPFFSSASERTRRASFDQRGRSGSAFTFFLLSDTVKSDVVGVDHFFPFFFSFQARASVCRRRGPAFPAIVLPTGRRREGHGDFFIFSSDASHARATPRFVLFVVPGIRVKRTSRKPSVSPFFFLAWVEHGVSKVQHHRSSFFFP